MSESIKTAISFSTYFQRNTIKGLRRWSLRRNLIFSIVRSVVWINRLKNLERLLFFLLFIRKNLKRLDFSHPKEF